MCVIIAIPRNGKVSNEEIESAWRTNSHGAGYMYRKDGKVVYKRGFMDKKQYIEEVQQLIGKYEIVLHLRISTSDKVNPTQTHPYELGDIMNMEGTTKNPVSCMNGVISSTSLQMLPECNDTMSYIVQNNELFKQFTELSNDKDKIYMMDFIKEHSGAKWCVMTPESTYFSGGFTEEDGVLYSNMNHRKKVLTYTTSVKKYKRVYMSDVLSKKLIRQLNKNDKELYNEVYDYISEYCNTCDNSCIGCLRKCKKVRDIKKFRKSNEYDFQILRGYVQDIFYDYTYDDTYYTSSVKDDYIFDE